MNREQQKVIISELCSHKRNELEIDNERNIDEKMTEFREEVSSLSYEELEKWWFSRVGYWINSMDRWSQDKYRDEDGEFVYHKDPFETPSEWQFQKILDGKETDYGF